MKRALLLLSTLSLIFSLIVFPSCQTEPASNAGEIAAKLLEDSGIKGGLVVHIGCGEGQVTAALCANEGYLVHGLDTDARNVEASRTYFSSLGINGKVAVDRLPNGHLPFIDNLVNLVIAEDLGGISMEEVIRVLAPRGVALIREGSKWARTEKPWSEEIDEWTHYLHDPQGTMVGSDNIVGPPRRTQWVGGPKWLRSHDFMASLTGMVSANGRVFYIVDEGRREHIYMPARWVLIARDAFNGKVLWRREIDSWFPHTFPFKSGPGHLPRRLVAIEDNVYVTLGLSGPVTALDAETGETIRTFSQTQGAEEIVVSDGSLYVVTDSDTGPIGYQHASDNRGKERNRVNQEFGWSKQSPERTVVVLGAASGEVLWQHTDRIAPLTLAVEGERVIFCDGEHVLALNRSDGSELWKSEQAGDWAAPATGYAARLIVGDDIVVLSTKGSGLKRGRLVGLSAQDGEILWKSKQPNSGHWSPEELYLINGLVWTAQTGKSQEQGTKFLAIDAKTGEVKNDFIAENPEVFFMHQRCYPGRATERFIMTSGTGTEFHELGTEKCELHHWIRGACIYGLMPSNGLLYKPPDTCACYYQSKLAHLCALAPAGQRDLTDNASAEVRLEKGPAYGSAEAEMNSGADESDSWPTYRHDNARSGAIQTPVDSKLKESWKVKLGGNLSAMTSDNGKLFVADKDRHIVYALAADSGETIWSFVAGGRVDSPPTIFNGVALFGCADGWVYCLRAADGRLVWRFRAAPGDAKLVSYQQVESVWPLHGSVLVKGGVAHCLAGRNLFLDGGVRFVRLDCMTGELLSETVLDDKDPRTGENIQTLIAGKSMPVANTDLFSSDEQFIYMGAQRFDLDGKRVTLDVALDKEKEQAGAGQHLFCPTGFLDEVWFHRSYWIYGKNAGEGHGEYTVPIQATPTGRLMVVDDSRVYGFFAHDVGNNINPRTSYSVYSADKKAFSGKGRKASNGRYRWELKKPGLLANAMVLAGQNLFLAGAPDVADEEKTFDFVYGADDEINRQMLRQEEAFKGKEGALLWVVSAETGEKLSELKMEAIPVWDGMIASDGQIFASLQDGTVVCLGPGI